jgi:prephenate dehydrogenase
MAAITLSIIGLHRLGASFGLAVKRYMQAPGAEHKVTVIGSDESSEIRAAAKKLNVFDVEARSLDAAIRDADLIVMAIPYSKYDEYYEAIGPELKAGAVIIDFSPHKRAAIQRANKYIPRESNQPIAYAVGATAVINPLYLYQASDAPEAARADLFDKGTLILSPDSKIRGEAIQLVSDFATLIGMGTHFTDPEEQDALIAAMEGLPILANLALFRSVTTHAAWDDLKRVSTPTFALATAGVAAFGPEDAASVINGNRENVLRHFDRLIEVMQELRELLTAEDELLLTEAFADAHENHEQWSTERAIALWDHPDASGPVEKVTVGGMVTGRLFGRFGRGAKTDDKK